MKPSQMQMLIMKIALLGFTVVLALGAVKGLQRVILTPAVQEIPSGLSSLPIVD